MNDNVVTLNEKSTRAYLLKILAAYDEGTINSVVIIGQGNTGDDNQRVLMPFVSDETTLTDLTLAATLLQGYALDAVGFTINEGEERDA